MHRCAPWPGLQTVDTPQAHSGAEDAEFDSDDDSDERHVRRSHPYVRRRMFCAPLTARRSVRASVRNAAKCSRASASSSATSACTRARSPSPAMFASPRRSRAHTPQLCVATFTQNSSLKTHVKKHLEGQQLACLQCGMMGLDFDLLRAHEKYHASVAKVASAHAPTIPSPARPPPSSWVCRQTAAARCRGRRSSCTRPPARC